MTNKTDAPMRTAPTTRLTVVGLGLVGGSVAKATRHAWPNVHITAVDKAVIHQVAVDQGVAQHGVSADDADAVSAAIRTSDLVVLALPVLSVCQFIHQFHDVLRPITSIDTGSTKRQVLAAAHQHNLTRFVGTHPMAGRPQAGLAHAHAQLFANAKWFVCGNDNTDADARRQVRVFIESLQAHPVEVSAADHDRDVAMTSHLPHVVVNALAEQVLAAGALHAAGGSLKQLLAVAGASFDVWQDTLATNDEAVHDALLEMSARLSSLASQLQDPERMRDLFAHGRACRERLHG
jgi:prephenate dehydrogenase